MSERNNLTAPQMTPTRRQMIFGAALALGGVALASPSVSAAVDDEISRTAESIHQEQVFEASPGRVYAALTDGQQFDQVAKLSVAMQSGMAPATKTTMISRVPGGAFSLFGGYITGRNVELVPNKRIVQAWRPISWAPGIYSIAKFEITEQGAGTKMVFDHTGFPHGTAQHLALGWHESYWNPLVLFLAKKR